MIGIDRLKAPLFALIRAAVPRVAYAAPRFASVVKAVTSGGVTRLDVVPEDPSFPSMPGVRLFHGIPGVTLTLAAGTTVLVEFSEMDPARPFVRSWAGGEHVAQMEVAADALTLGGVGVEDAPVKLVPVSAYFALIATHTHSGVSTGAGVSGVSLALATPPVDAVLGATSVKVK
jgi:hypothetical protein